MLVTFIGFEEGFFFVLGGVNVINRSCIMVIPANRYWDTIWPDKKTHPSNLI